MVVDGVPSFPLDGMVPGILRLERAKARPLLFDHERRVFGALGSSSGEELWRLRTTASWRRSAFRRNRLWEARREFDPVGGYGRNSGGGNRPRVASSGAAAPLPGLRSAATRSADLERQVDVYCFAGQRAIPAPGRDNLRRFLLKGGGVITVATPWAFAAAFPDFHQLPANEIAMLAGIEFLPAGTAQIRGQVITQRPLVEQVTAAARALSIPGQKNQPELLERFRGAVWLEPEEVPQLLPAIEALDRSLGPVIPTISSPLVPATDPVRHALVEVRSVLNQTLPAESIPVLPAAEDFPGSVPKEAARVAKTLEIDGSWRGWLPGRNAGAWAAGELRSTGLYAAPGEVVRIKAPQSMVGQGFELVIGSYQGGLESRAEWHRYPRTQRAFPIDAPETAAANGLGGLITIRVPRGAKMGALSVAIEGGVEAPWFQLGTTSAAEWRDRIRGLPGPWAELAGHRIILTVPSESIRALDDPDALMKTWDSLLEAAAVLASVDRSGYRAERLVFDRQTAAGSLHSEYPVAAHLGPDLLVALDARKLKGEGSWGFFHEFGHNHQHDLWSLPGTGETTCNLWSVYLFEERAAPEG